MGRFLHLTKYSREIAVYLYGGRKWASRLQGHVFVYCILKVFDAAGGLATTLLVPRAGGRHCQRLGACGLVEAAG